MDLQVDALRRAHEARVPSEQLVRFSDVGGQNVDEIEGSTQASVSIDSICATSA